MVKPSFWSCQEHVGLDGMKEKRAGNYRPNGRSKLRLGLNRCKVIRRESITKIRCRPQEPPARSKRKSRLNDTSRNRKTEMRKHGLAKELTQATKLKVETKELPLNNNGWSIYDRNPRPHGQAHTKRKKITMAQLHSSER